MGQVGSIDKASFKPPIAISNGLLLRKIHLINDSKIINVDNDNDKDNQGLIQLPKSPISEFVQNDKQDEFPFLLKCSNKGDVLFKFGISNELLSDFNQMNTLQNFTIFNNLKIMIIGNDGSKILKDEIISRVVQITNKDQPTKENNVISINPLSNQFEIKLNLNKLNGLQGKIYIKLMGNNEEIFKTMVYLVGDDEKDESQVTAVTNELKTQQVNNEFQDPQFEFISDGPAFRNSLVEAEEKLIGFRNLVKNVIKKSQALEESERNLAITRSNLCSSLSDLNNFSSNIEHPSLKDLINNMIPILTEKSTQNINDANLVLKNLTTPFLLYYNSDIKSLPIKKKLYQNQSKDFYSWMSNFNNNSQNEQLQQQQHFEKRLNFEKERLDYFNFLNEYRNGYLIRNLIHNLAILYQKITNVSNHDETISKAFFYYENFANYQKDQSHFRSNLLSVSDYQELSQLISTPTPLTSSSTISSRPKPISKDSSKVFKDGMIYSLGGKPEKSGWNKHYAVLNNNILSEFDVNEITHVKVPRSDPLDLTFSCIKKIDNISKRKYCFEIITPLNLKKIYQAESEQERESWLKSLNVAIALKASQNNQFTRPKSIQRSMSSVSRSKDDANLLMNKNKRSSSYRKSSYNPPSSSENLASSTPLEIVQDVDQSNNACCDCGSIKNVDWISINLLIVVCIDCSGVHRSMGTHISKIRSLTLDTKSFQSKEALELLYHVSNNFANSYWEGSILVKDKITPLSNAEQRRSFILDKYQNRKFLLKEPNFKPNDGLIKGINTSNIPLILKSLAMGANVKMTVIKALGSNKVELSLFEYSLTRFHGNQDDPIFDVSTILLLNNTPCGEKISTNLPLGPKQLEFWKSKIDQYHSSPITTQPQSTIPNKPTAANSSSSMSRSRSIRKSLSLKHITDKGEKKEKQPKDRTNRTSRLRFPKLK